MEVFMKRLNIVLHVVLVLFFGACTRHDHAHDEAHEDHASRAVTVWTEKSELFAEFPPLVAGQPVEVALHLTRLDNFAPVQTGTVTVEMRSRGIQPIRLVVDQISTPGIVRVPLTFPTAGIYRLLVIVEESDNDTLTIRNLEVSDSGNTHAHAKEETRGVLTTVLKEQQWRTRFRCEVVKAGEVYSTLETVGEIVPPQSGEALVSAPFSGYSPAGHSRSLPPEGTHVRKGALLTTLIPSAETQGGSEDFASRIAAAEAARYLAEKELARGKRLYASGIISEKEYQELETDERRADAAYQSLRRAVSRDASVDGSASDGYAVRAPLAGTIARVFIRAGEPVQTGAPLFHIVDGRTVWLRTVIPMRDRAKFDLPRLLSVHMAGTQQPLTFESSAIRRVSVSSVIDAQARGIPVIFELDNRDGRLAVGSTGRVQLGSAVARKGIAIPNDAVLEDEGQYFVFVQLGGESFERRDVRIGDLQGDRVEIVSGLEPGDRIVSVGAHLVRLAASAGSVPAHGHEH